MHTNKNIVKNVVCSIFVSLDNNAAFSLFKMQDWNKLFIHFVCNKVSLFENFKVVHLEIEF